MTITFKQIGDLQLILEKDSTGIIHIGVGENSIPLSHKDIVNLINTLRFLNSLSPDNLQEDSFPSMQGYIHVDSTGIPPKFYTDTPILTEGTYTTVPSI